MRHQDRPLSPIRRMPEAPLQLLRQHPWRRASLWDVDGRIDLVWAQGMSVRQNFERTNYLISELSGRS